MQRSHFTNHTPHVPYSRRDGIAGTYGGRSKSTNDAVELFVKFRTFRPYLKKRLNKIVLEGRERELRDEVDDIKYYLGVMSDMLADENHGAETLQAFIDRIHEMIRKNPLNDSYTSSYASADENEEDQLDSARSPSPTEIIDTLADTPTTARTIPLEREQHQFSYFGSLEESLGKRRKPIDSTPGSDWEPQNCDTGDTYTRRGTFQDIDMRDEARFRPMSNTLPLGRGSGVSHSRRWEDTNVVRDSFGRGVTADVAYRDRDERYARDYNNSVYRNESSYANPSHSLNSWGEQRSWNSEGRDIRLSSHDENYDRSRGGVPQEVRNPLNQSRMDSSARDYTRFDNPSYPSYERRREASSAADDSQFERRHQFERRRTPSNSNRDLDGSVQIDYNHGGASWDDNVSPSSSQDKDMRGLASQPSSLTNMYPPVGHPQMFDPSQHQQMFMNQQNMNMGFGMNQAAMGNFVPPPQMVAGMGGANSMMGMNMGNVGMQSNIVPIPISAQMLNPMGFPHQQQAGNTGTGLLPTPPVNIPNAGFDFRSPPPQLPRTALPPRTPETYLPSNNDLGHSNSTASSDMMKEISKQKAQQCFSRAAVPRRDNQNVPPTTASVPTTSMPQSNKAAPESLLATNQMLSDRDPRLNRLNKKVNQTNSTSQNDSTQHQNSKRNLSTTERVERIQISDPRLSAKNRVESRERNAVGDHRISSKPRETNPERSTITDPRSARNRDGSHERSENVDSRISSKSRDSNDNSPNSDPRLTSKSQDNSYDRSSGKNKEDGRNRSAKSGGEESWSNKRLDEVRDRDRSNVPANKTQKPSKRQEIQSRFEKEKFHALGRPTHKKNNSSFDEAIIVPIEKSPPPRHITNKDPNKEKSGKGRDSSKEKAPEIPDKKSQKDVTSANQKGLKNQRSKKDKEKPLTRKEAKQRESNKNRAQTNSNAEGEDVHLDKPPVKKSYFRIPKLKKPDPPPPPEPSPPPPDVEDSFEEENWETTEEPSDSVAAVADAVPEPNTEAASSQSSDGQLTSETENLIKQFILQSVDSSEAENIFKNHNAIGLVFQRLKEQVKQMCHDEQPIVASTSLNSNASEAPVPSETEAELPNETAAPEELIEDESKDPTTRLSRSVTRKKSTKRRSSLEKLHDALKEMRFDTMLPLGPRRCTRGPVEENAEASATSTPAGGAKDSGQATKQPKIVFNKDDLNKILASTEKSETEKGPEPATSSIPDSTADQHEADCVPVPSKRGRKRKRKGSKMTPNKKKKGPVTRAQAAVKTAIKVQQKDKGKPTAGEGKDNVGRKKKLPFHNPSWKAEGRVTRSMIGKASVVSNIGLEKIKIEADYNPPKAEPEDQELNDCITAGTGFEHLEDSVHEDDDTRDKVSGTERPANFIEMPSFIAEMEDLGEEEMSIDIKSEHDCASIGDPNDSFELDSDEIMPEVTTEMVESSLKAIESPQKQPESSPKGPQSPQNEPTVVMELQSDTDYDTDLSFLPDLPRLDSDILLDKLENLNTLLLKVQSDKNEAQPRETELLRGNEELSTNRLSECESLMEWMLDMVGYETDESAKKALENQLDSLVCPTLENCDTIVEVMESVHCSSNEDLEIEEPNDFYIIDENNDSEFDEEYDSSEVTESEEESESNTAVSDKEDKTELKNEPTKPLETSNENALPTPAISSIRNNEKSIIASDSQFWALPDSPGKNSSLVPVIRVADGFNKSILLQGFVAPSTLKMPYEQREACELKKLGPFWEGSRKTCMKSSDVLEQMHTSEKIEHFFKCMGTYCPYTSESPDEFLEHLRTHDEKENNEVEGEDNNSVTKNPGCAKLLPYEDAKILKDWQGCSYCSLNYRSPVDLKNHIINQHSRCAYQCTKCFYRAFYYRYIMRHFEVSHPGIEFKAVRCKQRCKSDYVEANVFRIYVYKCALPSCKDTSKRFIYRHDFIEHLKECSPAREKYPCHLCPEELSLDEIIEHYKIHSLFKYHCSYCQYASEEKDDLDSHFLYIHPNVSGRVFTRELKVSDGEKEKTVVKGSDLPTVTKTEVKQEPLETVPESIEPSVENSNNNSESCTVPTIKQEPESLLQALEGEKLDKNKNTIKKEPGAADSDEEDSMFDEENKRITNLEGASLYKCANQPCQFNAENAVLFKEHITTCIFTPETKQVSCFHCDKRVKAIPNLLEHMKVHGRKKQFCGLCSFKTWVNSELTRHMKAAHKVYNFKMETGDGEDPDVVVYPKDVASKIITLQVLKENYARFADRLTFCPEDIDKVPSRHIFHTLAYCSSCNYSSKVRVNFLRHLKMHDKIQEKSDNPVPESDPVNPVPCLERKELMFDKMTNWAGSTHAHKPGASIATDNAAVPQFVVDQFRYVCSVLACQQITVDEHMLKTHMRALHSEVELYRCPHCSKNELTKQDPRNSVVVDKLGNHLKLHGSKLYRCAYCDFISPQSTPMEKHLPEKHPEKKPIHYLIRNLDANGQPSNRRNSSDENGGSEKWRCAVCNSKTLFSSYEEVKQHCQVAHRVGGQFVCANCKFFTDSDAAMKSHVLETCEQKSSADGRIMVMWIRNDSTDVLKQDDIFHGPLWKRTSQSVKHIRGIFLEDVKENKVTRAENSMTKANSAAASNNTSGSNNISSKGAEKLTGKKSVAKSLDSSAKITTNSGQPKTLRAQEQVGSTAPVLMVCPKCNRYKTKNRRDMTVHLHNELSYQRYKCTKCTLKFVTENSLKGHYSGDHGLTYTETSCEMLPIDNEVENYVESYFAEQDLLQKSEEIDEKPVIGQISCKHCRQEFNSAHNLRTHVLAKHLATDRYKCKYCPVTFWCKSLARSHIARTHKDCPFEVVEDIELRNKITPAFWMEEYGIPGKMDPKKIAVKKDLFKIRNKGGQHQCPHCNFRTDDAMTLDNHVEEYHWEDVVLLGSVSDLSNGNSKIKFEVDSKEAINFVDELQGEEEISQVPSTSKAHKQENANLYKCFHCKDNFFTVRGVRSHWKRSHSKRPEERCNYYEYKAFNESMELPPWMELCCCHCEYKVSSMILMKRHHNSAHKNLPYRMKRRTRNGNDVYSCNHCLHECTHKSELQDHTDQFHPGIKPEYSMIDLQSRERSEDHTCYGKLIEDTVRYPCLICDIDFDSQSDCKRHLAGHNLDRSKDMTMKFSRQVLNHHIRVPADCEVGHPKKHVYSCPVCDFATEDRDKLIWEHMNDHIYAYSCPCCSIHFRTYIETKFHIRHYHARPLEIPMYSDELYKARELMIEELEPEDEPSYSNNMNKRLKKYPVVMKPPEPVNIPKVVKRRLSMPVVSNHKPETTESIPAEDDDVIFDEIVIVKHPAGRQKFLKDYSPANKSSRRSTDGLSIQSTSSASSISGSLSTNKGASSSWPFFENFREFNKEERQCRNIVNEEPEIIEIPPSTATQWGLDSIPGFADVEEEDPFVSTSAFNWEDWDGKS